MNAINDDLRTTQFGRAVSRRATLRGLGGAGLAAALGVAVVSRAGASTEERIARSLFGTGASDDSAAVIEAYVAAVNAGDLEGILALHDDNAVHIFLPTPDGSAGICRGKGEFRMWYEQSVANGDRVAVEDGALTVDGNQATFVARIASDPWTKLGLETLEAQTTMVLIDGRIMTHVALLTPESVRELQSARGATTDLTMSSAAPLLPSERRGSGEPY